MGFALQSGVPTVAGALGDALERVLRHPVELTCAGRTDAGVHAWGQVVSLDADAGADLGRVQRSLNKMLRPSVVVREAGWAPASFDARRWATSRRYRYTILGTPEPDPFLAATAWHIPEPLDVRAMQLASDPLMGEHDFSSFCRMPAPRPASAPPASLIRRVTRAGWEELDEGRLRFEVEANAFCQQMVRSIVGTMVEVGLGRRKAGDLMGIVAAGDRGAAGQIAPPHGLCLWEVVYPSSIPG